MSTNGILQKPKKVFYGWWIVGASAISNLVSGAMYTYGLSAFFLPISKELGWSRTQMSAPIGIARLEGSLLGPVTGYMVDRFGPRKLMLIGAIGVSVGFLLISRMQSLPMFYAIIIVSRALGVGLLNIGIQVAVVNWFRKRRGLGLGIAGGGYNIGAMAVPAVVWLIATRGWRSAAAIIGTIMGIVQIPLSLLMRHHPEPYGYLPDGMTEHQVKEMETSSTGEHAIEKESFTPSQAVRTRAFWFINIAYASRNMITAAVPIHLIAFIQDLGYSAALGGNMMAIMGFSALIGRVVMGHMADILPKRFAYALTMAMLGVSLLILSNAQSIWQLVLWAVLYGPGYGGGSPVMGVMVAEYYGRKYYGTINGLTHIGMAVTAVVGPVFAGYMFDTTGSYRLAFVSFTAVCAVGAVATILASRPQLAATPT